jgi:hypothetical protein
MKILGDCCRGGAHGRAGTLHLTAPPRSWWVVASNLYMNTTQEYIYGAAYGNCLPRVR